jgi:hypothetical protein
MVTDRFWPIIGIPRCKASATSTLRMMAMLPERLHDQLAVVALHFNHTILHGSA